MTFLSSEIAHRESTVRTVTQHALGKAPNQKAGYYWQSSRDSLYKSHHKGEGTLVHSFIIQQCWDAAGDCPIKGITWLPRWHTMFKNNIQCNAIVIQLLVCKIFTIWWHPTVLVMSRQLYVNEILLYADSSFCIFIIMLLHFYMYFSCIHI